MFSFSKTPILIREQRPERGEIGKKGLLVPHRDHSLLLLETVPVLKSAVALSIKRLDSVSLFLSSGSQGLPKSSKASPVWQIPPLLSFSLLLVFHIQISQITVFQNDLVVCLIKYTKTQKKNLILPTICTFYK